MSGRPSRLRHRLALVAALLALPLMVAVASSSCRRKGGTPAAQTKRPTPSPAVRFTPMPDPPTPTVPPGQPTPPPDLPR